MIKKENQTKLSKYLDETKKNILTYLKIDSKKIIINLMIIILFYSFAILFDRLTKDILFHWNQNHDGGDGVTRTQNFLFGIRSVSNYGAMLGLWENKTALIQSIALFVTIITLFFAIFSKNILLTFALASLGVGSLGNVIDRFRFNGMVKDIFFTPWIAHGNSGTFNLADLFVGIGAGLFLLYSIIQLILSFRKNDQTKKETRK